MSFFSLKIRGVGWRNENHPAADLVLNTFFLCRVQFIKVNELDCGPDKEWIETGSICCPGSPPLDLGRYPQRDTPV